MSDIAIRVQNLGKQYRIGRRQQYRTLRESVAGWFSGKSDGTDGGGSADSASSFWALKDVSFDVLTGEVVGIIGRNGAGKSTLLKVLSRITEPTTGRVETRGRVGSLLEVGTGFHSELTGRENVYLNGAILGMGRAEIARKFDEIVDFSGVEKFLDTPVKFYSSGMYMRLAFAVAAHLEPEILIVDEVLAVGDAQFQKKCMGKMRDVAGHGRTVLFVSHQMNAVQSLCTRGILLRAGQIAQSGAIASVVGAYLSGDAESANQSEFVGDCSANEYFKLRRFRVVDEAHAGISGPRRSDERIGIMIEGDVLRPHRALNLGFALYAGTGEQLFWSLTTDGPEERWPRLPEGHHRLVAFIPARLLNEGEYRAELIVSLHHTEWICQPGVNAPSIRFQVEGGFNTSPFWLNARPGIMAPLLTFEEAVGGTGSD